MVSFRPFAQAPFSEGRLFLFKQERFKRRALPTKWIGEMGQRLPVLSGREVVTALAKAGFREIRGRGKGSHHFVHRANPPKGITVPDHAEIGRGLLRSIIRQADLTVDEFLALL
jgi:predicted RNA binding protein YcfA (HicA-like mRNA interferase family)